MLQRLQINIITILNKLSTQQASAWKCPLNCEGTLNSYTPTNNIKRLMGRQIFGQANQSTRCEFNNSGLKKLKSLFSQC